jgi:SAM-dependent methyltransferase
MAVFGEYAEIYDVLYEDKDYANESRKIDAFIREYTNNKKVLNLGCGTGRHDRELAKYGYKIHGIDFSSDMIQYAKKNIGTSELSYEVADIRNYITNEKYPVILSLFHVISYQKTNEDLLNTFRCVSENLEKNNGIFIFDAWYGTGVLRDLPSIRVKKAKTKNYKVTRIANPVMHITENLVDVNYEIIIESKNCTKHINECHVMRYLFTPEIKMLLDTCGLKLVKCIDCNTFELPGLDTWTAYFIVKHK